MGRFSFKTNINYDIALLTEVEEQNPYAFKNSKAVWSEIATKLNGNPQLKMEVNERSCRERAETLIKAFNNEERLSCKLSGVEEQELNAIKYLLTNVTKLWLDKSEKLQSVYSKCDRQKGDTVREEAIQELNLVYDEAMLDQYLDEKETVIETTNEKSSTQTQDVKCSDTTNPPKKKLRKTDVVEYLEKKSANEMKFKQDELKVRMMEAENKTKELDITQKKIDGELEVRKIELELQKTRQNAESEERKMMTSALIKVLSKE